MANSIQFDTNNLVFTGGSGKKNFGDDLAKFYDWSKEVGLMQQMDEQDRKWIEINDSDETVKELQQAVFDNLYNSLNRFQRRLLYKDTVNESVVKAIRFFYLYNVLTKAYLKNPEEIQQLPDWDLLCKAMANYEKNTSAGGNPYDGDNGLADQFFKTSLTSAPGKELQGNLRMLMDRFFTVNDNGDKFFTDPEKWRMKQDHTLSSGYDSDHTTAASEGSESLGNDSSSYLLRSARSSIGSEVDSGMDYPDSDASISSSASLSDDSDMDERYDSFVTARSFSERFSERLSSSSNDRYPYESLPTRTSINAKVNRLDDTKRNLQEYTLDNVKSKISGLRASVLTIKNDQERQTFTSVLDQIDVTVDSLREGKGESVDTSQLSDLVRIFVTELEEKEKSSYTGFLLQLRNLFIQLRDFCSNKSLPKLQNVFGKSADSITDKLKMINSSISPEPLKHKAAKK